MTFTPAAERVVDRVPALERRQQRGVRVHDPVLVPVVDRLVEDGAEAGHRDQVHPVAVERVDDPVGVREPVEVGAVAVTGDGLDGNSSLLRTLDRSARTVDDDGHDGQVRVQQGLENGPSS